MTEATRPDPEDQPVVLAIDEVQSLWSQQVRLRPDARIEDLLRAGRKATRMEDLLAGSVVDLCASLGIEVVEYEVDGPPWQELGDPDWPDEQDPACAAFWFDSLDATIRFHELAGVETSHWGNYGPTSWLRELPYRLRLLSERGVYGRAVPHADLRKLVDGLARAVEARR